MKAVILAAGEGRRLEPLTNVRPKPMIPIANRPLLEYVVDAVVSAGIEEIILVVGYKRERIQNHFGDGDDWGVDIEYAIQRKQLGTGHAILQVESLVEGEFIVLNGDRIIESTIVEQLADTELGQDRALMAITRSNQPSDYGVVELTGGDLVEEVTEKPPTHAAASDIINAGVYVFGSDIFEAIRATETDGELTITAVLDRLTSERSVRIIRHQGLWLDVSHLWDIISVNASVLDQGWNGISTTARIDEQATTADSIAVGADTRIRPHAAVLRGSAIGDNVTVGPNAVIENAVVFSDVTIGAGAVLTDCVIGENARIGPNTTVEGGRANVVVEGTFHEDVRLGGVIGDNAALGGNVTVAPGSVVGNRATVESAAFIDGRIASETEVRRG